MTKKKNNPPPQFHNGSIFSHKVVMTPKEVKDLNYNRCDLTLKLKLSVLIYGDVVFNAISLEGACKITKSCQVAYEHIQTVHVAVPILSYIILTCQGWHWLPRRHFSYGRTNHCFSFPTSKR